MKFLMAFFFLFTSHAGANCLKSLASRLGPEIDLSHSLDENWRELNNDHSAWSIHNNEISPTNDFRHSDLISLERFGNFAFTFEFKLGPGANSGVKYLIQEERGNIGLEFQIIDKNNPNSKVNTKRQTGALYDLFSSEIKNLSLIKGFNRGCIIFENGRGEHWLNGELVLKYSLNSVDFHKALKLSKFKTFDWFGTFRQGHLLLQDHGDKVTFKKVHIQHILRVFPFYD